MATTTNAENDESGVSLRIEGDTNTIFDGRVTINCRGAHQCDRTNGNHGTIADPTVTDVTIADPTVTDVTIADPTVTDVLHTASEPNNFGWECTYYKKEDGCFITRIGDTCQDNNRYWRIYINYRHIEKGACQERAHEGNNVLFAFDGFNKTQLLKLEASHETIARGESITVTVTDGNTGERISDAIVGNKTTDAEGHAIVGNQTTDAEGHAIVGNQTTDAEGHATFKFNQLGAFMIKAEHPDSIRSNTVCVKVIDK